MSVALTHFQTYKVMPLFIDTLIVCRSFSEKSKVQLSFSVFSCAFTSGVPKSIYTVDISSGKNTDFCERVSSIVFLRSFLQLQR